MLDHGMLDAHADFGLQTPDDFDGDLAECRLRNVRGAKVGIGIADLSVGLRVVREAGKLQRVLAGDRLGQRVQGAGKALRHALNSVPVVEAGDPDESGRRISRGKPEFLLFRMGIVVVVEIVVPGRR